MSQGNTMQQVQEAREQHKIKNLIDFRTKKSVHISLFIETHKEFRKNLLDKDLSIQEVFEKFARLVNMQDKRALKILEELVREKREGILNRLQANKFNDRTAEDLYAAIKEQSPLNEVSGVEDVED